MTDPLLPPPPAPDAEPRAPRSTTAKRPAKRAQPAGAARGPGRPTKEEELEKAIHGAVATIGIGVGIVSKFDGLVLMEHSADLADALAALAMSNPKIRKAIEAAVSGAQWSSVLAAVGAIVLPIAAAHGLAPTMCLMMAPESVEQMGGIEAIVGPQGPVPPGLADLAGAFRRPAAA